MFSLVFACRAGPSLRQKESLRMMSTGSKLTLPSLPYAYDALAPVIIPEIMEIHHTKHHQAYVNGFNAALEELRETESKGDVSKIVILQSAVKFNGGGHINHAIFWKSLIPPSEQQGPQGQLAHDITKTWGSVEDFISKFNAAAAAVQGSGWGWLGFDPQTNSLRIATTVNQDPLFPTTKIIPLVGVDVWEHAYYLQYKNVRPDYLREIWKVINWTEAAARYEAAKSA